MSTSDEYNSTAAAEPQTTQTAPQTTQAKRRRPGTHLTKREQYQRAVQANLNDPNRDEDRHCLTPGNPILARIVQAASAQGDAAPARPPDGRDLDRLDSRARAMLEDFLSRVLAGEHELDAVSAVPGLSFARLDGYLSTYPTFSALYRHCNSVRDRFHASRRLSVADNRARAGSDRLLICLLGGDDPHRYGRQVVNQHTGSVEVRDGLSRLMEEIAVHGRFDPPADRPRTRPMRDLKAIEVAQSVDSQEDNDS
jgi:hypothetical protein